MIFALNASRKTAAPQTPKERAQWTRSGPNVLSNMVKVKSSTKAEENTRKNLRMPRTKWCNKLHYFSFFKFLVIFILDAYSLVTKPDGSSLANDRTECKNADWTRVVSPARSNINLTSLESQRSFVNNKFSRVQVSGMTESKYTK